MKSVLAMALSLAVCGTALAAGMQPAALSSLREAAAQGDAASQFRLARIYETGEVVAADAIEARYWIGRAAQQGHGEAQLNQGLYYTSGRLFPADLRRAYGWLLLAEAADQPLARPMLNDIAARLSEADIAAARAWAADWERTFGAEAQWRCQ